MKYGKLIKRWADMIFGKSIYHVKQGVGKHYNTKSVKGYYNDLTGKVSDSIEIDENGIPITTTITGVKAYFPIAIFQYGLGLYDLYLETKSNIYKNKFIKIANWAVDNIDKNGMWNCMDTLKDTKHKTQSAMCQSEGISVLIRAYIETNDSKYKNACKKAYDYMITDVEKNGTCSYKNNKIIFQEYVYENEDISVLNGWIFSIFGIYDYYLFFKDSSCKKLLDSTFNSLANELKNYDSGFWTYYDQKGTIASPAYHNLHIQQLILLYDLSSIKEFYDYSKKWEMYEQSKANKFRAMIIKLFQKIKKNKYYDINTSTVEVKK